MRHSFRHTACLRLTDCPLGLTTGLLPATDCCFAMLCHCALQDVVAFPSPAMLATMKMPPLPGMVTGLDGERYIEKVA